MGGWLGAASFWAVGYAGYLFPVLLALYGVSAFVRPADRRGLARRASASASCWSSAAGMLARLSDTPSVYRIHKGGVLGWAVSESLRPPSGRSARGSSCSR